jgi:hypothetical protein
LLYIFFGLRCPPRATPCRKAKIVICHGLRQNEKEEEKVSGDNALMIQSCPR